MQNVLRSPIVAAFIGLLASVAQADTPRQLPSWVPNLLQDASISGNLASFESGLRGAPEHVVYDPVEGKFPAQSSWHEYGVGLAKNIGVVPESKPAYWQAEWNAPVTCNLVALSGVYPNQPQPDTAWKIEFRTGSSWSEHARGVGGWYDGGRYHWRVPMAEAITFDAIRVSVFSGPGGKTLESIHFRGESGFSWVVAAVPEVDVVLYADQRRLRLGESFSLRSETLRGEASGWHWDFGDGNSATGESVKHTYSEPGTYTATLTFASGDFRPHMKTTLAVGPPVEARITPLETPVRAGTPIVLDGGGSQGPVDRFTWDTGDGTTHGEPRLEHAFEAPGVYETRLTVSGEGYEDTCMALVRVLPAEAPPIPQLLLDTDQKNEQDDQYFLGYAIFSEMDLLGVNSVHHGGGQEQINYDEILKVRELSKQSGAPEARMPTVYRGADQRLDVPPTGKWFDTLPLVNEATEAILAAARGASPENPVWIVPVGPGTNVASAVLLAREEGLDLSGRIRVMWLGGSNEAVVNEFNGNNDPWSLYVIAESGIELWIMPAPVGARVRIDKRTESDWYPDNPLGDYLEEITPAHNKALYDPAVLSAIIDIYRDAGWVKEVEAVTVGGPAAGYEWTKAEGKSNVTVIRTIDQEAMKRDLFDTLKGKPTKLR